MSDRKKFVFLTIFILAALLFAFVYISINGSHLTLHTHVFLGKDELPKYEYTFDNENVVKLTDARMEKGELVFEFDSLNQGETTFNFTYDYNGTDYMQSETQMTVGIFNILIYNSLGEVSFNGYMVLVYAIVVSFFAIMVVMLWIFAEHNKKGDFSHTMIACGGIGIYTAFLFLYITYKIINNSVVSIPRLASLIKETGGVLLIGLTPIMLFMSVMLAVSNIWLIRHEGRRPVNTLGIIFAVLWGVGMTFTLGGIIFLWKIPNSIFIWLLMIYIVAYFECMFISTVACTILATRFTPSLDRDYIIILGCAIRKDGSLTPLLKGRVDSAVAFEKKQFEKTGKHAIFVPSGGQGDDEVISEGEAMEKYLLGIGVPKERILREDKSVNTMQNMQFSGNIIKKHSGNIDNAKIAFATTNYHVFRGYILAKKCGFKAQGISAKTKPYFYLNAFLREFIGLLADKKWSHIAIILTIAVTVFAMYFFHI